MRIGLHITTYKNVSKLEQAILSVAVQERKPDEIIVLDDGSSDKTADFIESIRHEFPDLKYIWQEDDGFRLARVRNLGVLASKADYIISVDGDMILHKAFVQDHLKLAKRNFFIQGTRQCLSKNLTDKLLHTKRFPTGLEKLLGREKKNKSRAWGLHSNFLSRHLSREYKSPKKIMGCNQSFFREDLLAVNGYSNSFIGWGEEDYELSLRLFKFGLKEIHLRHGAIAWHLYHPVKKRANNRNQISKSQHYISNNGLKELKEEIIAGKTGQVICDGKPLRALLEN